MGRPRGVTVLAVLFVISGVIALYLGYSHLQEDFNTMNLLNSLTGADVSQFNSSQMTDYNFLRAAVPFEAGYNGVILVLALFTLVVSGMLFSGRKLGRRLAPVVYLLTAVTVAIYAGYIAIQAPPDILASFSVSTDAGFAAGSLIWGFYIYRYLRTPHATAFLSR